MSQPFDPMTVMDSFHQVSDSMAGFRSQLMAKGFTEQQAGDLVVEIMRQVNLESVKKIMKGDLS